MSGVSALRTIEVRLKVLDVKKVEVEVPDFGDATAATATAPASMPQAAVAMDVEDTNTDTHGYVAHREGRGRGRTGCLTGATGWCDRLMRAGL